MTTQPRRFPALYVSHGAPSMIIEPVPARDFLAGLGRELGAERPTAILCATAHWLSAAPMVSSGRQPSTLYDFYGFPDELYAMTYAAPGSPQLAERAARLLTAAGMAAGLDERRGFDHGTWAPLKLIYPDADIPVVQLSIQPERDPAHHLAVGQALRPLRDEGVLIVGSGALTHNLEAYMGQALTAREPEWVSDFAQWIAAAIDEGRVDDLVDYRRRAPHAVANHPTDEHFLPLFVALGAGAGRGRRLHASVTHGVIRMDAFAFD